MTMDEHLVVKIQDLGSLKGANIHRIFSELCGEIRNIYPCSASGTASSSSDAQYFVEFKEKQSAERACKLRADNMVVLTMSRDLIEEYRSIIRHGDISTIHDTDPSTIATSATKRSSSYLPASSTSGMDAKVPSSTSNGKPSDDSRSMRRHRFQTENVDAMAIDCARALSPASASSIVPAHQLPSPVHVSSSAGSFLDALKSSKPSLLARIHDRREKENVTREPSATSNPLPSMPLLISRLSTPIVAATNPSHTPVENRLTIVSGPSFTLDTGLVMTLCGELINYNLESLENDPATIINLLKVTSSERDKWMVVACHYRRKANFKAAILVITSMIEVMKKAGIPETDLKPAHLMLSSCETQISKRLRTSSGENTKASLEHAQNSARWLQKVYGEHIPVTESSQPTTSETQPSPGLRASPSVQQTTKAANVPSSSSSRDRVSSSTCSDRTKISIDLAGDAASLDHTALANMARFQMLEREIQSLRDRERNATTELHAARSAKRKLDDDFHAERTLRRKLERKLNDVEGQLDISKKMENFALDQMKREVDARRRAEEKAEGEREKRKEAEATLKARGSKPLFEDLADMFQRAAKGEGIVLPANLAGGSGLSRSSDK